jgi:hypothetical protein
MRELRISEINLTTEAQKGGTEEKENFTGYQSQHSESRIQNP